MVPLNSVQREPSMEEILASIRRIIEDSDTTRKTPDGEADRSFGQDVGEVGVFRAELRGERHPEGSAPVADTGIGFDLPEPASAQPHDLARDEDPHDVYHSLGGASPVGPAPSAGAAADEPAAVEVDFEMHDLNGGPMNGAHFAVPQPMVSDASPNDAAQPAIISEQAGRQVAASFGELSDAFAARSRRSFDEIAQEMMRPMLQDWLDNNLPHLVEKLVREEIERIARGAVAPR